MLQAFYSVQEQSAQNLLSRQEKEARQRASQEATALSANTYDSGKVRLSGAEGNLVLAEFSRRLYDPELPDPRRDIPPVCSIRTWLFDNLIAGEQRSFQPVGKYHYLLKEQLQPGQTTVRVSGHSFLIDIPEESHSQAYLLTLYKPPGQQPQLHAFPVAELIAVSEAHIPPWLPDELELRRPG